MHSGIRRNRIESGMKVTIFLGAAEFREWLEHNHDKAEELWLGIYNQRGGGASISYREALDEALCFGWIDGLRKSVNQGTYTVRFTPRKTQSYWSAVNIKRFGELKKLGRLAPPGVAAFEKRSDESGKYSFENRPSKLDPALEKQFRAKRKAWEFFNAQAPWYQRTCVFWVMSAKKEETRLQRLSTLIRDSENGRRIGLLTPKAQKGK